MTQDFWSACLARFESELAPKQFETWIKPLRCIVSADRVVVEAPSRFILDWVRLRYLTRIESWISELLGDARTLEMLVRAVESGNNSDAFVPPARPLAPPIASSNPPRLRLNPALDFHSFVPGRANELARAMAIQVAERPGSGYNPLFIYGSTSVGKTHLLQAIGNHVLSKNPQARVNYIHADDYIHEFVSASRHQTVDSFKREYQTLDLLLIDDIQFFSNKTRTQEEFFYSFNWLLGAQRQVVVTCDTFHKDLQGVEDRLKARLGWGLTVSIEPPELELRVAILTQKAAGQGVELDQDVAFFIANQIRSNVRVLEGALNRVLAHSSFTGIPISTEQVRDALKDILTSQLRQVSVESIQRTVAEYYRIRLADMHSPRRTRNLARPRQVAMSLARELTPLSLPEIGEAFGGRHHTTVLHACREISELRETNNNIRREYDTLINMLTT